MRLFSWCVFTCSRLYTQNDICNTRILSNPVEFYFFYQQQKFKLTVPLTQKDLRTPQAKAVQFRCCIGICKNKSFYVLHGYNNLYAPNLYFLEALIFNGEDDVSLIRKRRSISGEHSLRNVVNAVRYVVRMNSRACLCY